MEEEIGRVFQENNFALENADTIRQCVSLCSSFGLKPSTLVEHWEVFYLNSQLEKNTLLNSHIDKFRVFLQTQQRNDFIREHGGVHIYTKDDLDTFFTGDAMLVDSKTPNKVVGSREAQYITPPQPRVKVTPRQVPSPTTPFSQRTTKCTVQFVFNDHLPDASSSAVDDIQQSEDLVLRKLKDVRRCQLEELSTGLKPGCRYMADQVESRFNELERRIKKFVQAFSEYESVPLSQHVAYASQEKILVVGRVCYDTEEADPNAVLLEGSVEYSGGHRVRLDLREISQFSLFPGQILVVEGHNPSGHCLVASRIFYSLPLPPHSAPDDNPLAKRQATDLTVKTQTPQPLHMIVASGPFTTSDNLSFEPLMELLAYARNKRPNVLLLMGPFVDAEHPHVKQGITDRVLSHVFQEEITTRLEDYCQFLGAGARVILIPSTRDVFHDRIFPQPPFNSFMFEDSSQQISLLPNPSVFRLDEVSIGCCTTDILRHLSSEEAARNPPGTSSDRMSRLGAQLVGQRSFYPLFPPALGTCLDLAVNPSALDLPCTPDIIVLSSDLVPFVKSLSYTPGVKLDESQPRTENLTTLLVNPGRLAKGAMGGTFVEAMVTLPSTPQLSSIGARAKLSFIKI
ncbi:DNA polymerase alpha subunit B isoform X1 [Selaginella moellendorffii]|uniref:DNA polymerase alpha subunit B isoform X1 n=2 Tax=Selaginella moellendorffii TaxID=88036 RepID=UPI000D1CFE77|nr:DNA polymerase alpha subunit B isoform X1 [Selaginella moellendorffii]|eukprot:XP_024523310.1 DNA polymerase alpha subunit B isoform X1 [Selaginella moellendorffii]